MEAYRRMPDWSVFALAAIISWFLAAVTGIAGGFAAMFLYDRGKSKGDDLAVLLGGLLAVGTFTYVLLFTWLRKLRHEVTWRTPLFALLFCVMGSLLITGFLAAGNWDFYWEFILVGWIAILLFGLGSFLLSQYLFIHETD